MYYFKTCLEAGYVPNERLIESQDMVWKDVLMKSEVEMSRYHVPVGQKEKYQKI